MENLFGAKEKNFADFIKTIKKIGLSFIFGYFWMKKKFFIGFWKDGKQNGIGKYIKDNNIIYGRWKDGKKEKEFISEEEFINCFNSLEAKYIKIFQWNKEMINNFMKVS